MKPNLKNEEDKASNVSPRRSNSIVSVPSQVKSINGKENELREGINKTRTFSTSTMENTKDRRKSVSPEKRGPKLSDKKTFKRLSFKKKFVEIVNVDSYKRYNVELCYSDPVYPNESSKCRCQIF